MLFRPFAFVIVACCCSAQAAEIKAIPLKNPGQGVIVVNGGIKKEDKDRFLSKISPFSRGVVVFNSKGGSALAAIGIGRAIRMRGFTTWVPSGSFCASACAIAWLGGARRLMGKTALIGFHSVYKFEHGTPVEAGAGNAVYGAYLSQLGLSDRAIMYLSNAAPTSMNWLTPAQAQSFGIDLRVFDPKTKQAGLMPPAAMPPAAQAGDLETRAHNFVLALNIIISGPSERYLKVLNGIYADQVRYFGKQMQRAAVVSQRTEFVARWPIRSYVVQPHSLKVQCDAQTSKCQVSGQAAFDLKSPSRKQRAHGMEMFDYLLSFRPGVKWPMIVNESGSVVINRKAEAGQAAAPRAGNEMGLAR
jgi:hypothetical protein